jgi:saccharopine dehydrogenase (NAD+, L-lysine-forming)
MRISVLGGAGLVGQCAVYDLAADRDLESLTVADIDLQRARRVARKANDIAGEEKVRAVSIDITQSNAHERIGKTDLIINAVQYYFNEHAMRIALRAGAHYVDFGGLYWMTKRQLKHSSSFRRRGLLAIPGMGAEPGMSGIFAAEIASGMDTVETIRIRDAWRDFTKNIPPFFVTWSIETLMDEYTMPAEVYENGRIKQYRPLSLSENYSFPSPVGDTVVYVTRHSEIATFPASFRDKGIKNVSWMEGGPGFVEQKVLADAGFAESKQMKISGCNISPRKFLTALLRQRGLLGYPPDCRPNSFECLAVDAAGREAGNVRKRWTCVFPSKPEWGVGAAEYSVGIPGATAARFILRGETDARGVVPPELALQPESFIKEVKRKGFKMKKEQLS